MPTDRNSKPIDELASEIRETGKQIASLEERLKELTLAMAERLRNMDRERTDSQDSLHADLKTGRSDDHC